jgi:hypothetical protein
LEVQQVISGRKIFVVVMIEAFFEKFFEKFGPLYQCDAVPQKAWPYKTWFYPFFLLSS